MGEEGDQHSPHDAGSAMVSPCSVAETSAEEYVGVGEQAFLQRNDDELAAREARLEQLTDVLRVRKVQGGINLVQDVHRCRFELQQRHDQAERDERSDGSGANG